MLETPNAAKRPGFLSRLRKDQGGNTIAMFAAAVFPLVGLIGGGLDMSRVYLTKTRLQAACDAGALAGRKQMGVGAWAANTNKANTEAVRMFNLNFASNSYGTTSTAPTFVENAGSVTGTASATIPMTLMRIFGSADTTISVSCIAAMSIPNTDIMFVLDTTGSMGQAPNGGTVSSTNPSKMSGLRVVAKCFYEALAKVNIASVTPADCNETANPSGGNASGSQIRFGFVPYSSNVNVGKLFKNDWMADSFTYQSRAAVLTPVWVYSLGSESAISYGGYNNPANPSSPSTSYVAFTPTGTTNSTRVLNGTTYNTVTTASSSSCSGSGKPSPYTITATTPTEVLDSTSSAAPVYPATTNPFGNYTRTLAQTRYFYQWVYDSSGGSNRRCRLQEATYTNSAYNKTATGTSTKPVSWTQFTDTFTNWEYRPVTHTVSGLKVGGSSWNSSINLPTGYTTQTLLVSGTTGATYNRVANESVAWDGCIEERKTLRTNSWSPYPSNTDSPDLDFSTVPTTSDPNSQWKPSLKTGIWLRYVGGVKSQPTITTSSDLSTNAGYACPSAARLLSEYNGASGATSFESYLDGLVAAGSTYHDIGMLWGGRLILPNGIFSANNMLGAQNGIDRHIIFMTDGDTDSGETANTAYGRPWWDRRQEVDTSTGPDEAAVDVKINARLEAICNRLTDVENITVWVVSYGGSGISATTKTRLKNCSTNGETEADNLHYFDATNTAQLLSSFKSIASAISQLRLTN